MESRFVLHPSLPHLFPPAPFLSFSPSHVVSSCRHVATPLCHCVVVVITCHYVSFYRHCRHWWCHRRCHQQRVAGEGALGVPLVRHVPGMVSLVGHLRKRCVSWGVLRVCENWGGVGTPPGRAPPPTPALPPLGLAGRCCNEVS